jgi:hypothetical protein
MSILFFCTTARFTVGGNQISGQIVAGLGGMSKLEYIWLFENDLTGGIPTEIGLLENLIAFDAVGNDLTGGLSTIFTTLPNLQVLQLGDNPNLGGTIPTEYGNFASSDVLTWLNIENCGLTGDISDFLSNNNRLEVLRLGENEFTQNPIPSFIYSMTTLTDLRLQKSNRNSGIDENIGNLKDLQVLKLEDNFLAGAIPTSLGSCSNLTIFTAGNQFLSGSIPTAVIESLVDLEELDLHKNQLNGPLSIDFGVFPRLREVRLQENALTGELVMNGARRLGTCVPCRRFVRLHSRIHSCVCIPLDSYLTPTFLSFFCLLYRILGSKRQPALWRPT